MIEESKAVKYGLQKPTGTPFLQPDQIKRNVQVTNMIAGRDTRKIRFEKVIMVAKEENKKSGEEDEMTRLGGENGEIEKTDEEVEKENTESQPKKINEKKSSKSSLRERFRNFLPKPQKNKDMVEKRVIERVDWNKEGWFTPPRALPYPPQRTVLTQGDGSVLPETQVEVKPERNKYIMIDISKYADSC